MHDFTIYNIIKRNARILRNRVALIYKEKRVTHKQFLEYVDRLSCGISNIGLRNGDRIAVLAQNNIEFFYLIGASAKTGTVMLPINWRLSPREIEFILYDGKPSVLFVENQFYSLATQMFSKFDFIKKCYSLDNGKGDFVSFNTLLDNDGNIFPISVRPDDPYLIMYTAAVSGNPRGATLSQRGLIAANLQTIHYWNLTENDCKLNMLPLCHLADLGTALSVMHSGGTNIILPKFDASLALKQISEHNVTVFSDFPPILNTLLNENRKRNYNLSSLRYVSGGNDPEIIKRFEEETRASYWTGYGQTETSGFISFKPYFEKLGSVGLPSFLAEVEIMDDTGKFANPGEQGEIVVKGPMVFLGYWNRSKDNEYTFRNGWHHTGDLGYFDEDRYLFYIGRRPEKELIKSGGENIYPSEVERAIMEHPAIKEVAVIGVPDEKWGEAAKAICVIKKDETLEKSELTKFLTLRIAGYKKPQSIVFVNKLPKSSDGSLNRQAIKSEYGGK